MNNPSVTLQLGESTSPSEGKRDAQRVPDTTMPDTTVPDTTAPDTTMPAHEVAERIMRLFQTGGHSMYGGERVTQLEHALQCAWQAERSGAAQSLIVAALLHDLGHLLQDRFTPDSSMPPVDDLHEDVAATWLSKYFGPEVVEPVRMHVAAKRFLCATDPVYFGRLSEASQLSLKLQGGPMSTSEVGRFLAHPHYRDAVLLRRWDDEAKVIGVATRSIDSYLPTIIECVRT